MVKEETLTKMFVSSHGFGVGCNLDRKMELVAISSNLEGVIAFYPKKYYLYSIL